MMNEVDSTLIIILAVGGIIGVYFGLIRQFGTLISVWAGAMFSGMLAPTVGNWISLIVDIPVQSLYLGSFIVAFIIISVGIKLGMLLFMKYVNFVGGGLLNRLFGGLFGLFLSALLISVTLNIMERFLPDDRRRKEISESRVSAVIMNIAPNIVPRLSVFLNCASDKITDFVGERTK